MGGNSTKKPVAKTGKKSEKIPKKAVAKRIATKAAKPHKAVAKSPAREPTKTAGRKYVKVAFFRGTWLLPVPPGESKTKEAHYLDIHEAQFADWVKQASQLSGDECAREGRGA